MKTKAILGILIFAIFIGGAYFAYNFLIDKYKPNNEMTDVKEKDDSDTQSADISSAAPESSEDTRIKAPDFTVTDIDGNEVKLSDFLGKLVVLNFWASWCSPCKREMPHFDKVFLDVKDDVQFLMVDLVDGKRETVKKGNEYITDSGYSFPVYFDTAQEAANAYGIMSIPTTVFIDSDGYVITGYQGTIDEEIILKGIEMITSTLTQTAIYTAD